LAGSWANFWLSEAIRTLVLLALAYALGRFVLRGAMRVNYTRKILHFALFFVPLTLYPWLPFRGGPDTALLSSAVFLATLLAMSEPVRTRVPTMAVVFTAFDRPEDRPYTLAWLLTQIATTYVVLLIFLVWLQSYDKVALIYVTVLVAAIGDGLAEPVGVRFGRHRYGTRALFTDRRYTRSLEGSACVLASGFLAVCLLREQFQPTQFALALAIIPAAMTLAEAWSPHTWDGPFLYLAGGLSTIAVLEFAT
jgi:dolichol kinase